MPPIFKRGITVKAITIIPMPPNHCKRARQSKIPGEVKSSPLMTVAPVVVNPEMASKKESVWDPVVLVRIKGNAAKSETTSHVAAVRIKVSRMVNVVGPEGRLENVISKPMKPVIRAEIAKDCQL